MSIKRILLKTLLSNLELKAQNVQYAMFPVFSMMQNIDEYKEWRWHHSFMKPNQLKQLINSQFEEHLYQHKDQQTYVNVRKLESQWLKHL